MKNNENIEEQPVKGSRTGSVVRTFADVPGWVNMGQIKRLNTTLAAYLKKLFTADKATRKESFEQALGRLGVTEEGLKVRFSNNRKTMFVFGTLTVILLAYAIYLLFAGVFAGFVLAIAVTALLLVKTYQYSFWNFQIKNRRLGCTFKEWMNGKVNNVKPSVPVAASSSRDTSPMINDEDA